MEGAITIGLYAINPSTQRCKWVAIDANYKNAMEDHLLKLQYHLIQDGVEPALEMSKRGGHLWIFLATPLLARECRIYVHDLALRLGVPVKGSGLADGIEVFPKHDAIGTREFGNAIRGPLGIHRGANRRFWFYGADYTLRTGRALGVVVPARLAPWFLEEEEQGLVLGGGDRNVTVLVIWLTRKAEWADSNAYLKDPHRETVSRRGTKPI